MITLRQSSKNQRKKIKQCKVRREKRTALGDSPGGLIPE